MFIKVGRSGLSSFGLNPARETRRMSFVALAAVSLMSIMHLAIIYIG